MIDADLPTGQYLSCNLMIRPGSGGQTRALLTRSRILQEQAGVTPRTLIFEPAPDYPVRIAQLISDDVITESMPMLNLYDTMRVADLRPVDAMGRELETIAVPHSRQLRHDGSPYRKVYEDPATGQPLAYDYEREDGTVFARVAAGQVKVPVDGGARVSLVDRNGQIVQTFRSTAHWYRHWMVELCPGDDRVFAFMDSRNLVPKLTPLRDERFHLIYVMHNQHTVGARHWNSPSIESYRAVLRQLPKVDGWVNLTARQSEDIALRWGATNNRFVVPNPIRPPQRPDPLPPRDPHRLAIVARLEPQKGLPDAIRAFALVRKQVPQARLDLYGDGTQRALIEKLISDLGIADAVTMHGHVTAAQETLWTASGFFMPSVFEGYPLASLESMAHGCPVIAYDIKYGPREQIDDGVDGFLVRKGDIETMADRAVRLLRDPDLVARMSEAALAKAAQHNHERFLRDWKAVLESVIELKPHRTELGSAALNVRRLTVAADRTSNPVERVRRSTKVRRAVGGTPLKALLLEPETVSAPVGADRDFVVNFVATLQVSVRRNAAALDEAVLSLTAICEADGTFTEIPLEVRRRSKSFSIAARFSLDEVFDRLGPTAESVWLRLRFDWRNSTWETPVTRSANLPRYEADFAADGQLRLTRRAGSTA